MWIRIRNPCVILLSFRGTVYLRHNLINSWERNFLRFLLTIHFQGDETSTGTRYILLRIFTVSDPIILKHLWRSRFLFIKY